jgi:ATP-binding cassette subfamily E protein 1
MAAARRKAFEETDKLTRIAIINADKCKPKRCRQECKKSCPVVRMGKLCIEVAPTDRIAVISETLCIGCGICVKVIYFSHKIKNKLLIVFNEIAEMSI